MKNVQRARLLAAVLGALPLLGVGSVAQGQYRVGEDGHANDANNRIGSGGYNSSQDASKRPYGATGNQIVTGNSTGLSYFHGNVAYTDPGEFRQSTGTNASDRFLAVSGPVNYAQPSGTGSQYQQFYSDTRLVGPPASGSNLIKTPGGGGLVGAPPLASSPSDTRLGIISSVASDTTLLPTPGELAMPGPVDPSGSASALTASPLYGLRQWSPNDVSDAYFLSRYTNARPQGAGATGRLDNAAILRMRQELNNTVVQPNLQQPANGSVNTGNSSLGGTTGGGEGAANPVSPSSAVDLAQSQQLTKSAGGPVNQPLSGQPLTSTLSNQALASNVASKQGVVQRLLIPPEEQSTQIAELERRYSKLKGQMTDQQSNQLYNRELALRDNPPEDAMGPDGQPRKSAAANAQANSQVSAQANVDNLGGPDYAKANQELLNKANNVALNPVVKGPLTETGPYVITSLATGVRGKGLADLLKSAEDQMRQGKFTEALDTYDSAQQVAPNNPFIALGRAMAELGASYYGRAETDFRRAFAGSPAVLAGRYDLKGFLGEDRLKFVVKDLKDISAAEKGQRSVFLLAYIFHNVGDDESASKYLSDAEQRATSQDPALLLMRTAWGLPARAPAGNP